MGGRVPGICGAIWPLLPTPPSGIRPRIWVPGCGRLLFFVRKNGTKWHRPVHSSEELKQGGQSPERRLFLKEVRICFDVYKKKKQLFTSHFQCKLMKHLTLWGLCGLLIISTRFSSENQALEFYIFYPLTKRIHLLKITSACTTKRHHSIVSESTCDLKMKAMLSTYLKIFYYSVKFY